MAAGKRMKSNAAESGDAEDSDQIDEEVIFSIEKLQELQDELDKVNEEASEEVLKVELKYNEICRPIYSRRNEIIHSIPDFWLTAFLSHPALSALINEEDQKILKHLVSLDVKDFNNLKSGYSITLNFSPNPYFEEKRLTKTYTFFDEVTVSITATAIMWKNGMVTSNGSAHKKKCSKRPFEVVSFFSWFSKTQQETFPDGIVDEIAEIIREDLWPNPLKYFNNDADEEDFDVDNDDDEDEGINDDEGNEEDDN